MNNISHYFQTKIEEVMKEACPDGVDCFFDNVGGHDAQVVINNMNLFGRVSCCGAISTYNDKTPVMIPPINGAVVGNVSNFFTASKYCGSGLKIDLVVVVVVILLVIKLLSNSTAFSSFNVINIFRIV